MLIDSGVFGVLLFFGLSGFILTTPFFQAHKRNERIELKKFYIRRISRIEPPYFITLVILFVVQRFVMHADGADMSHFLCSLFYIHSITFNDYSTINPVAWSLEVEVQFYILVPFIIRSLVRVKRLDFWIISIMIAFSIVSQFVPLYKLNLGLSLFRFGHYFFAGILASYYLVYKPEKLKVSNSAGVLILITAIGLFVFGQFNWQNYIYQIQMVSVFILIFAALGSELIKRILSVPLISIIGGMCYTIYLLHFPMLHVFSKIGYRFFEPNTMLIDFFVFVIPMIVGVLFSCGIFFVILEKPFMYHNWFKVIQMKFNSRKIF